MNELFLNLYHKKKISPNVLFINFWLKSNFELEVCSSFNIISFLIFLPWPKFLYVSYNFLLMNFSNWLNRIHLHFRLKLSSEYFVCLFLPLLFFDSLFDNFSSKFFSLFEVEWDFKQHFLLNIIFLASSFISFEPPLFVEEFSLSILKIILSVLFV